MCFAPQSCVVFEQQKFRKFSEAKILRHFDMKTRFESQPPAIFDRSFRQIATHPRLQQAFLLTFRSRETSEKHNALRLLIFFYLPALVWFFPRLLVDLSMSWKFDPQISLDDDVILCMFSSSLSMHIASYCTPLGKHAEGFAVGPDP